MLISVVIPTCHRNDLLARCLDRLAPGQQTLATNNYEVIVSDDGSRSTAQAMLSERYPWARWTAGPRRGPAANRNHGVRQAQGEWIAFTDDDCVPSARWLGAYRDAVQGQVSVYEGKTTCEAGINGFADEAPINLAGGKMFSCNLLIAHRLFCDLTGFDEHFPHAMEDVDFAERLQRGGHQTLFVSEAVVDHPPRPRVSGFHAGKRWESRVYYAQKWEWTGAQNPWLPLFICKYRIGQILSEQRLRDYPKAICSTVLEVAYVAAHEQAWRRKYQRLRASTSPASSLAGSALRTTP